MRVQPAPHIADLVAFVRGLSAPLVGALEKTPAVVPNSRSATRPAGCRSHRGS
jgi:hypothetical protein